jgi:uncharacterized protein YutE (UPF0331/DUF86 family)
MMYDTERMARICGDIDRYTRDLSLLSIHERRDLEDRKNFYALAMVLFSLMNAVIDLADELVSARNAGMPSTYREIFTLLVQDSVIDTREFEQMSRLVSYRNRLAHEYGAITPDDLMDALDMTETIRIFVERAKRMVREEMSRSRGEN